MQWLNIQITDLHSEQFLGSDPTDRATWLALLGYCASQENGGTINGAGSWSDRMCQQVLGVTKNELHHPTQLWAHHNDCVTVWAYPVDQERVLQAKRKGGKAGGIKSGESRKPKSEALPEAEVEGVLEGMLEGVLERKGKERKGKKGNTDSVYPSDFEEFWQAYPKKKAKGAALKAWKATSSARCDVAEIVASINSIKTSKDWVKDGGQWIPYPATWINSHGWADELSLGGDTKPVNVGGNRDADGKPIFQF